MAHKNDNTASTATLTLDPLSLKSLPDPASDNLSIFSAPALEVVSQWWLESKRRWAELNGTDAVAPVVRPEPR
jgi:hypothetical protein